MAENEQLAQKVMGRIGRGEARMKSKAYFLLGTVFLGVGLAGVLLLAVFFAQLVFWRLRTIGPFGYLWFGSFGLRPFLATLPWLSVLFALASTALGVFLLRRYEASYRVSFLGLITGLVTLVLALGLFLDLSGVSERVARRWDQRLQQSQFSGRTWVVGQVAEVAERRVVLVTPQGETVAVVLDENTLLPFGADFEIGQRVRVVGKWQGAVFLAKGIGCGGLHWRTESVPQVKGRQKPPRRAPLRDF